MDNIDIKSSIKEEGNVKLKVVRGKKILKTVSINNKATKDLFFGIAMVLLKRTYDSTVNYSPRYLGLGKGTLPEGEDVFTHTDLEEPLTMSRVPIRDDSSIKEITSGVSVTFQGIVPYSSVNDQDIYEIGLFGTETGGTLLARVQLPGVLKLELGTSLIVEWTIYLKNA